MSASGSPSLV
jgi:hypothetical protein